MEIQRHLPTGLDLRVTRQVRLAERQKRKGDGSFCPHETVLQGRLGIQM